MPPCRHAKFVPSRPHLFATVRVTSYRNQDFITYRPMLQFVEWLDQEQCTDHNHGHRVIHYLCRMRRRCAMEKCNVAYPSMYPP
jgi:hypothetical protein